MNSFCLDLKYNFKKCDPKLLSGFKLYYDFIFLKIFKEYEKSFNSVLNCLLNYSDEKIYSVNLLSFLLNKNITIKRSKESKMCPISRRNIL